MTSLSKWQVCRNDGCIELKCISKWRDCRCDRSAEMTGWSKWHAYRSDKIIEVTCLSKWRAYRNDGLTEIKDLPKWWVCLNDRRIEMMGRKIDGFLEVTDWLSDSFGGVAKFSYCRVCLTDWFLSPWRIFNDRSDVALLVKWVCFAASAKNSRYSYNII